jgi:prepilin-type N-terminal cleavage/methylation domain-containing protein
MEESGFTLIELVVVILILGILTAVGVPSYISLQARADKSAAETNVRAITSDIEAYYSDNGTFTGISAQVLHDNYDSSIVVSPTPQVYVHASSDGSSFVACAKSHGYYGYKDGPAAIVAPSSTRPTIANTLVTAADCDPSNTL